MFPGHIGIMWSIDVVARCRRILRDHPQRDSSCSPRIPPLGVLLAGLIVRLRERIPWIADFRDPIGVGTAEEDSCHGMQRFWNHRLEALVFRSANAVVANVDGAATVWRNRYPQATAKIACDLQWL